MNFYFLYLWSEWLPFLNYFVSFVKTRIHFLLQIFVFVEIVDPESCHILTHDFPVPLINRSVIVNKRISLINQRSRLNVILTSKNTINFKLSPNKISLFYFIGQCPPCLSSLQKSLNQIRIISSPNISFQLLRVTLWKLYPNIIGNRNLPNKIIVMISLKRNNKRTVSWDPRQLLFIVDWTFWVL